MIYTYLAWVKVWYSTDCNVRPQVMILSNIRTLMTLVHIIKKGGFTYDVLMEKEQIRNALQKKT